MCSDVFKEYVRQYVRQREAALVERVNKLQSLSDLRLQLERSRTEEAETKLRELTQLYARAPARNDEAALNTLWEQDKSEVARLLSSG